MNTSLRQFAYPVIVALSIGAAFAAHAESPTVDNSASQSWTQVKTRDQVSAELFAARADGSAKAWSSSYNPLALSHSVVSREEVRAQVRVKRALHPQSWAVGEDSGSFVLAQQWTTRRDASRVLASVDSTAQR